MDTLPDFVQDVMQEEGRAIVLKNNLTGWETVRFQVVDEPGSEPSTAAFAP
jgi:hypothetical protein